MSHLMLLGLLLSPATTILDISLRLDREPCPFARHERQDALICRSYLAEFRDHLRLHSMIGSAALLDLSSTTHNQSFVLASNGYRAFFTSPLAVGAAASVDGGTILLRPESASDKVRVEVACANGTRAIVSTSTSESSFRYAPYGEGVVVVEESYEVVEPLFVPTGTLCRLGPAAFPVWTGLSLMLDRLLDAPWCESRDLSPGSCAEIEGSSLVLILGRVVETLISK